MSFLNFYILNPTGEPVEARSVVKWAQWFDGAKKERQVGSTRIGKSLVSTVFLGINHNFGRRGAPILWETMVFGGPLDEACERCSGGREQAGAMHAKWVSKVKGRDQDDRK